MNGKVFPEFPVCTYAKLNPSKILILYGLDAIYGQIPFLRKLETATEKLETKLFLMFIETFPACRKSSYFRAARFTLKRWVMEKVRRARWAVGTSLLRLIPNFSPVREPGKDPREESICGLGR
jgi:hypothetical protein